MDLASAIVTLVLVMDPLGNVPVFLSVLKTVRPERRRRVIIRVIPAPLRLSARYVTIPGRRGPFSGPVAAT